MANGYDVSYAQGPIAWADVLADFVLAKASESTFADRWWPANAAGAQARGIPLLPYHFAHPDEHSADDEAAVFLATIGAAPIVGWSLDFETRGKSGTPSYRNPLGILGADACAAWSDRFAAIVAGALNLPGDWYSFRSYASAIAPRLKGRWRGVWLASASDDPNGPYLGSSYGPLTVFIEQYGQRTDEPGFADAVDVNVSSLTFKPPAPPQPPPEDDMPSPIDDADRANSTVIAWYSIIAKRAPADIDAGGFDYWVHRLLSGDVPAAVERDFAGAVFAAAAAAKV